jgi:hypothetical protein
MLSVREIASGDGFELYGVPSDWAAFRAGVIFAGAAADTKAGQNSGGLAFTGGLRFEAVGINCGVIATDRYRLAWAELNGHDVEQLTELSNHHKVDHAGTIPVRELLAAIKPAKVVGPFRLVIDNAAGVWSLAANDSTVSGRTLLGDFPKWRPLIPEISDTSAGGFSLSPDLLAGFMSGISKAFKVSGGVKLSQAAENRAVMLSGFSDSARGLIMPIRTV